MAQSGVIWSMSFFFFLRSFLLFVFFLSYKKTFFTKILYFDFDISFLKCGLVPAVLLPLCKMFLILSLVKVHNKRLHVYKTGSFELNYILY